LASKENPMIIEIIRHTPLWVFVLFIALLIMGYMQSKDRTINRSKVVILPVAMIGLSLYGVISAFGIGHPIGLFSWIAGIFVAGLLCIKFPSPAGVSYSTKDRSYSVPGSWFPLFLMMAIFFIKYAVGVILARKLPIANEQIFIAVVSFCYGLISGIFLARTFVIYRSQVFDNTTLSNRRFLRKADTTRLR
jgi:hypothetical protein